MTPEISFTTVNIGAPDPALLARFYQRLLGWTIISEEEDDVMIGPSGGGTRLSFQREIDYVRPVWPAGPDEQQMMMHLELQVQDLEAAAAFAVESGATMADSQPQDDVRVCLDGWASVLLVDRKLSACS